MRATGRTLTLLLLLVPAACAHSGANGPGVEAVSATEREAVRQQLRGLVAADEEVRRGPPPWVDVDRRNTEQLKQLLDRYGWIRRTLFGSEADQDAWIIAHHADHDPELQERVLKLLEPLLATGDTNPQNYAALYDRVARNRGAPRQDGMVVVGSAGHTPGLQRYGTMGECVKGRWEPYPMEEPDRVDERRAQVGLPSLGEYRRLVPCQ